MEVILSYRAELIVLPDKTEGRKSERHPARMLSSASAGVTATKVIVRDISETGCRIAGARIAAVGSEVWLRLSGVGQLRATLVWARENEAGLEFATHLSAATVEMVIASNRRRSSRLVRFNQGATSAPSGAVRR
jgi:hypothetical protein